MSKLPLLIIFSLLCICFAPKITEATSYKTHNLKYDIQVDIPASWKITPKETLRITSVVPDLEFLLIAEDIKFDKQIPPGIMLSVRKGTNLYTEEKLSKLSLADFQSIHDKAIDEAVDYNKRQSFNEIDLKSIRIFIEKVDDILALGKSYNSRTFDNKILANTEYIIPIPYGDISIKIISYLNTEARFGPIIDKILSSIKIGKTKLRVDDIGTFLNSLKE